MAIQAVDWFVPEHHLSMYWFKVSFLRGVSPRSTDLGTGWEVLRVLSLFDAWWHANNLLLVSFLCIGLRCRFYEV